MIKDRRTVQIFWLALIIILTAASFTVWSFRDTGETSGDMAMLKIMVAKDLAPGLFGKDYFLGNESPLRDLYLYYTPFYRWVAAKLWILTGSFETGMAVLVPFAVSIYLVGMVLLLKRLTGNVWISLAIALAATGIRPAMFQDFWGVGTSHFLPSLAAYAAITPIWIYLYLKWLAKPEIRTGIPLGLLLGLTANLHPTSALNLALLAGALFLLENRGKMKAWKALSAMAACTALGALPVFFHLISHAGVPFPSGVSAGEFREAVHYIFQFPFRPNRIDLPGPFVLSTTTLEVMAWVFPLLGLSGLWLLFSRRELRRKHERFLWLVCGLSGLFYAFIVARGSRDSLLFFLIAAIYVIHLFRKGNFTFGDRLSFGWMFLVIFFSLESAYILNLLWEATDYPLLSSLAIELPRASRFIYLPVFFLNGIAAAEAIRRIGLRLQKRFPDLYRAESATAFALLTLGIGLILFSAPELSRAFGRNPLEWNLGAYGVFVTAVGAVILISILLRLSKIGRRNILRHGNAFLIFPLALIFFTPVGSALSDFSPVPLPILPEPKIEYITLKRQNLGITEWASNHTPADTLFFWCDMDSRRDLFFRADARRGMTHARRDFFWAFYTKGALVDFYRHYLRMTKACGNPDDALQAALDLEADFLLAKKEWSGPDLPVCYSDEWYVVYGVKENCPGTPKTGWGKRRKDDEEISKNHRSDARLQRSVDFAENSEGFPSGLRR